MKRFVMWVTVEASDAVVNGTTLENLLRGAGLDDLRKRNWIVDYGVKARQLKDGETPSALPPEGMLPKMGKA